MKIFGFLAKIWQNLADLGIFKDLSGFGYFLMKKSVKCGDFTGGIGIIVRGRYRDADESKALGGGVILHLYLRDRIMW